LSVELLIILFENYFYLYLLFKLKNKISIKKFKKMIFLHNPIKILEKIQAIFLECNNNIFIQIDNNLGLKLFVSI